MTTTLDVDHPWPGPDSFRTEDAAFFRGRDDEIQQLLQLVHRARSVVLYGASGLGKTSLINAGVVPRLAADEYFAVPIRVSYVAGAPSVSEQLQAEIFARRSGAGMPRPRPDCTAWELLHLRDEPIEGAQPLLIFDQFEELFTIGASTPQAAQLIEELAGLIEGTPPPSVRERLERDPDQARQLSLQRRGHRVLLGVREDFLFGLESLRAKIPSLIHNRFRIGPLSGAMALEVVLQRPAGRGDAPATALATPDVAVLIVRTVAAAVQDDRPLEALEVEPALLSILCTELARRRAPGTPITRELVTGSRAGIISSFYERAVSGVSPTVRAYVEDELVTATGFRTSAVLAEALTVPGFTSEVLSGLVNKRVVRVIERANGKWLELTHDILTEIAVASRKLRYERQRAQDELEQERHDKERRDLRKTRRWLTGVVVALSMAVAGWLLAIRTGRAAARAADEAEQQRQVAQRAQQDERRQKDIAEQARQDERRQKDIAERAERDAINERDKAATTLAVFQHNQQIRQAALSASGNNLSRAEYNKQLVTLLSDNRASTIKFTVEARDQKWKDGQGREIYDFWLSPRRDSLEAGEVAFITYFADHPTFYRTLMVSGPDRGFRVTYTGWGCLTRIVAVIEFTKPVPIAVAEFDMCKILGWN